MKFFVLSVLLSVLSASHQSLEKLLQRSPEFTYQDLREVVANAEPGLDILGEVLRLPGNIKGFLYELFKTTTVQLHHLEIAAQNGNHARLLKFRLCTTMKEETLDLKREYQRPFDMARLEQITCNSPSLTLQQVFDVLVLWDSDEAQFEAGKSFLELHGLKLTYNNLPTPVLFGRGQVIQRYYKDIDLTYLYHENQEAADELIVSFTNMIINPEISTADKTITAEFIFGQLKLKISTNAMFFFTSTISKNKIDDCSVVSMATEHIMRNGVMMSKSAMPSRKKDADVSPIPEKFDGAQWI